MAAPKDVQRAEEMYRAALADGPVPCAAIGGRFTPYEQTVRSRARRNLGLTAVKIDGVPHYALAADEASVPARARH